MSNPLLPVIDDGLVSRRGVLKACGATLGLGAWAAAIAPIVEWSKDLNVDEFLQKHYRELTAEQKVAVFKRLEEDTLRDYGASVTISDPQDRKSVV